MECSEVQKRLTAYLEGTLPPEERALVEEHLAPCRQCSQSLAELKRTLEHLQGLPEVEPPPWLAQKVMARVRSEAETKRGIWQFLFYPIHIKLPLEAAGVIAIAVTTIYVFKTMQPAMHLSKAPLEEPRGPAISEMAKPPSTPESRVPPTIPEAARVPAPAPKAKQQMPMAELGAAKPEYEQPGPVPPIKETSKPKAAPPPADTLTGAGTREESKPEALFTVPSAEQGRKEVAKDELEWDRRSLSAVPRAKALAERAEKKGDGLRLTLEVEDLEAATREIEKTVSELGGKILQQERQENITTVVAELSSDQLQALLKRLKPLGALKGEETEPEAKEGGIRIVRLEISRSQ